MHRTLRGGFAAALPFLLLLGGVRVAFAQRTNGPAKPAVLPVRAAVSDSALVAALARADEDQVAYSKAALPSLRDPEVKRFAQMVVDDHTAHETRTSLIAGRLGVTAPAPSGAAAEGAGIGDAQYLTAIVDQHRELLASLPADPSAVQDQELRRHLIETRTAVQMHLGKAMGIKARIVGQSP